MHLSVRHSDNETSCKETNERQTFLCKAVSGMVDS